MYICVMCRYVCMCIHLLRCSVHCKKTALLALEDDEHTPGTVHIFSCVSMYIDVYIDIDIDR